MAEDIKPHPVLKALEIMTGTWDLQGRDFTTNEEIHGQSTFEWLEGGFFLVHRFSNQNPGPLEYTWEVNEDTFLNWFGEVGADNHYQGKFSEDGKTLIGQWEWPGGGYEAVMTRIG